MEDNLIDQIPKELTKAQQWQIKQAQDYIKAGEWMLYGLGAINLLYLLFNLHLIQGIGLWISISLSVIYILAGIGTRYNPFFSITGAFILYLLTNVLNYWLDPSTLFSGIIFKVVIVIFFCTGIFNGLKVYKINKSIE